jgi:hypothetical protein
LWRESGRGSGEKRCKVRKTLPHRIEGVVPQPKSRSLARKRLLLTRSAVETTTAVRDAPGFCATQSIRDQQDIVAGLHGKQNQVLVLPIAVLTRV